LFDLAVTNTISIEDDSVRKTSVVILVSVECSYQVPFKLRAQFFPVGVESRERDVLCQCLIEGAHNGADGCVL